MAVWSSDFNAGHWFSAEALGGLKFRVWALGSEVPKRIGGLALGTSMLLDLVRGSITCTSEADVVKVYELACKLTVDSDRAEVMRVKNGFHTPGEGASSSSITNVLGV